MLRQLDQRSADGLTVTLDWDPVRNTAVVTAEDEATLVCIEVDRAHARDAFYHPYVYAG